MIQVISLGAGKQSSYMLLNALDNKFKFKPDFAIYAETGSELEITNTYVNWLKNYVKIKYNFDIIFVTNGNLMNDIELYVNGNKKGNPQIPLRLKNGGILNRHCTSDYKLKPIRKYLQSIRKKETINLWIGISLDEIERIKYSNVKYITHYYPLIEKRIKIENIVNWFKDNNMQEPTKSSCLICPFHSMNYWRVIKNNFPKEFKKACDFDELIRNYPKIKSETYLSSQQIPLKNVDFYQQQSLFPELIEECFGLCGL